MDKFIDKIKKVKNIQITKKEEKYCFFGFKKRWFILFENGEYLGSNDEAG